MLQRRKNIQLLDNCFAASIAAIAAAFTSGRLLLDGTGDDSIFVF